jgi:hypothetical protein
VYRARGVGGFRLAGTVGRPRVQAEFGGQQVTIDDDTFRPAARIVHGLRAIARPRETRCPAKYCVTRGPHGFWSCVSQPPGSPPSGSTTSFGTAAAGPPMLAWCAPAWNGHHRHSIRIAAELTCHARISCPPRSQIPTQAVTASGGQEQRLQSGMTRDEAVVQVTRLRGTSRFMLDVSEASWDLRSRAAMRLKAVRPQVPR